MSLGNNHTNRRGKTWAAQKGKGFWIMATVKPVQNNGRRLVVTVSKCGSLTSLVQTVDWMRWAAVPISATSSLCVSVVGGMLCFILALSVCTLCYAVDQLFVSCVLTASVRETRKDKVILDQRNIQKKHDNHNTPGLIQAASSKLLLQLYACLLLMSITLIADLWYLQFQNYFTVWGTVHTLAFQYYYILQCRSNYMPMSHNVIRSWFQTDHELISVHSYAWCAVYTKLDRLWV